MKLYFSVAPTIVAQKAFAALSARYGATKTPQEADVIVALGGDGQALRALQEGVRVKKPVFGLNFGHVGFLQNLYDPDIDLSDRIARAEPVALSPLKFTAHFRDGSIRSDFAINEIHVCNHNRAEGIYLRVSVNNQERIARLGADGLIISTTIGSSGYNKSARGPVLPLGDDMVVLTPNNPFTPDRIRSAVIRPFPITVEVIDPDYRQTDLYCDTQKIGERLDKIDIKLDTGTPYRILFDPGISLHEKIMRSQFQSPQPGG